MKVTENLKNIEKHFSNLSDLCLPYDTSLEKEKYISDEWLFEQILNGSVHGHPTSSDAVEVTDLDYDLKNELLDEIISLCSNVGGRSRAVSSFYPENGYMGWHTNWNAPGLGILFSWSKAGDGCFKSYNDKTKNFEIYQDEVGWNVKGVYMRDKQQGLNLGNSWHCVDTNCERFSVGFLLSNGGIDVDFCYETLEEFGLNETPNGIWI